MKPFVLTCTCFTLFFASCKKSHDTPSNPSSAGTLVRVQQGTDRDLSNDTVYLIRYNASNKIASIVDSLNQDTLVAAYDAATGRLSSVKTTWNINSTYSYDGSGQLSQINYLLGGSSERYTFEYSNGVVSKKSYYSNLGSGNLSLQSYYTYVVTNGNITSMSGYTNTGALLSTITYTYGTQPNNFKDLSLFNYGNQLGMENIINTETYFNKNLVTSASQGGTSAPNTYTFNGNQLTKATATDAFLGDLYTWTFSYKQ